jgi:pilus assembly protein CpaE
MPSSQTLLNTRADILPEYFTKEPAKTECNVAETTSFTPVKRQKFLGFVSDTESAEALETAFEPIAQHGGNFHVVNFRTTLAILSRMVSPDVLLVDLTGEEQPLSAMMELAELVEPDTTVLVIGQARELSFYRAIVNGLGVKEYLAKPLTYAAINRHFLPFIQPDPAAEGNLKGGKIVAIAGARGGVGTTTISANLAWMIGHEMHRHTMLLDTDLQTGTTALALNVEPGRGFAAALSTPERMDSMLVERCAQPAGNRLHVMASLETLGKPIDYTEGASGPLTKALRGRYKFILADAGARQLPFAREMLNLAHQRIIVLDPSIMSLRNLDRLNALPGAQVARTILVLNQAGRPYGLSQAFMEQAIGMKFDVVIPDLPRILPKADKFGDMAASIKSPFRDAISKLATKIGADTSERSFPKIMATA